MDEEFVDEPYDNRIWPEFESFMGGKDNYGEPFTSHGRAAMLRAFQAGWSGRFQKAVNSKTTSIGQVEWNILKEHFDALKRVLDSHLDHFMSMYRQREASDKLVRALQCQVEEMGGNPDQAHLHRRISEQRRQLRALEKALADSKKEED